MPIKDFPDPPQPHPLKEIVKMILTDPNYGSAYAQFIHDKACRARAGDSVAANRVKAHFQPDSTDLNNLNIPPADQNAVARCTDPRMLLIAFTVYYA